MTAADRSYVEAFNRHCTPTQRLVTECVPEPYAGPPDARLVVLALNPGFHEDDLEFHRSPDTRTRLLANVRSRQTESVVLGLLDAFAGTPAGRWWRRCFKAVLAEGHDAETLARQVLVVQFHGYHSRTYSSLPLTLPSQTYNYDLVGNSVERGATVVVLRGLRYWRVALPPLGRYSRLVVASPRAGVISPRSCGHDGFAQVLDALR